jgi:hypothetical protein
VTPDAGAPRTLDDLAADMIPVVCELACLVRDGDARRIGRRLRALTEQEWFAFGVVAAAMIPDDAPTSDLLAWLEPGTPQRDAMLGKAHGRASKRQARGLLLWGPLRELENEYQQRRKERREAEAKAA